MKRKNCAVCFRAKAGCICDLFTHIDNNIHVVVLQHPSEVNQTKGTLTLLAKSLRQCTVIVGEVFDDNEELTYMLSHYHNHISLLYPSEQASKLTPIIDQSTSCFSPSLSKKHCIILLDGTWKKAYKMYKLNGFLHAIPHLMLPENIQGNYRIRSTQKAHALSSLEACVYALGFLENNTLKYLPLLKSFNAFNDLQLSLKQAANITGKK